VNETSSSCAKWLRQVATEIAREGHNGWGNTCEDAARHVEKLERENAQLREALNLSETHRKRTPDCICPACKEIKARAALEAK
jgi:hypothetical protein